MEPIDELKWSGTTSRANQPERRERRDEHEHKMHPRASVSRRTDVWNGSRLLSYFGTKAKKQKGNGKRTMSLSEPGAIVFIYTHRQKRPIQRQSTR